MRSCERLHDSSVNTMAGGFVFIVLCMNCMARFFLSISDICTCIFLCVTLVFSSRSSDDYLIVMDYHSKLVATAKSFILFQH